VTYRYPAVRRPAIDDVSLAVGTGEIVGLTGANDAGKSTLCLIAAGLAPTSVGGDLQGDVLIEGLSIRGLPTHALGGRVGIVFAEPATQLSGVAASVFEEVALGPVNLGCPRAETLERVTRTLDRLGISGLAPRSPERLSGGQQQLVAIASMLAMEPRVLVLDEPVAELDAEARRLVAEALVAATAAGTAVLVAEHDLDLLRSICDRIVGIDGGRLRGEPA
jgi:energy-coupling factor transport system ATP-binding protein